jgi:membrane-bound ClpP family serine protease
LVKLDPLILAIVLYFVALVLAAIDIFVPSGGLLMLLAVIVGIACIAVAFRSGSTAGLLMATVVVGTVPVFFVLAIKIWPRTPMGRRILLKPPAAFREADRRPFEEMVGKVVVNRWPLMPMGPVEIGKQRWNAISSDGRVIDPGQRIKVVGVRESSLVVVPTDEPLSLDLPRTPIAPSTKPEDRIKSDKDLLEAPAEQLGLDRLEDLPLDRDDL